MNKTKPFCISKQSVMAAWQRVKTNKGAEGVDQESIEDFERDLKDNLSSIATMYFVAHIFLFVS